MVRPSTQSGAQAAGQQQGETALATQLDRLPLDHELGRIVRDGLSRLPQEELDEVASDLKSALDALEPAIAQLHGTSRDAAIHLGRHVTVKGDVEGSEDLVVNGYVEGNIRLATNVLTIGATGSVKGEVRASTVIVYGLVEGPVTASERVDLRNGGRIAGNIGAPRVAISDGADFQGSIDMAPVSGRRQNSSEPLEADGSHALARTQHESASHAR